jgi:hypothetical protein
MVTERGESMFRFSLWFYGFATGFAVGALGTKVYFLLRISDSLKGVAP